MSETAREYLILGAIVVAVLIYFYVRLVMKTARLNDDPLQNELAGLILEYANSNLDEDAATLFAVSSQRAFVMRMVTEQSEQQSRFAHALSLARQHLTPAQYEFVRTVLR
jgi:hypothetical protein